MKILFCFMVIFFLSGCAAKKLAVENADTILTHQITKRIPLYSKEKNKLEKDVDRFLNDSKPLAQELLPVVDSIDIENQEEIEPQYKKLENYFMKLSKDFSKLMSKYMAGLDKKQREEFFETLDDENREILKKDKEERIDEFEERFEAFFGSVKGSQKQIIREYSDYFQERARERLARRVKLHENFRNVFTQDLSTESKEKLLHEAFIAYQEKAQNESKNLEILKKLLPTLNSSQKEHFRRQVKEIKELLKYFISLDY